MMTRSGSHEGDRIGVWKKVYVRDAAGVMRALPGIKVTKRGTLWMAQSVYDFTSHTKLLDKDWKIGYLKDESEWGYGR